MCSSMLHCLGSSAKLAIRRQCGTFRQFCNCGTEFNPRKCHSARRNSNSSGRNNSDNSGVHIPEWNSKYNCARVHHTRCNAKLSDSRNGPEYYDSRFHAPRHHARSHHSRFYRPKRHAEYNYTGVDVPEWHDYTGPNFAKRNTEYNHAGNDCPG
jgi:hypothetical protein